MTVAKAGVISETALVSSLRQCVSVSKTSDYEYVGQVRFTCLLTEILTRLQAHRSTYSLIYNLSFPLETQVFFESVLEE